jgi:oligopeptide transport system substrate-binding protein
VSEDGTTYRFKLRSDAKWSNGDPVMAGDFVFSFRRVEDPKSNSTFADELYPIKNAQEVNTGKLDVTALGVTTPDERTVEITLKAPTPYFLQVLTVEQAMPLHEKTVRLGEDWVKPGKIVSNGAYMLDDWKPSSHIRLVKNPHYWNAGKVAIDTVVFDPTENRATDAETLSRRRVRHHLWRRLWRCAQRSARLAQAEHAEGAACRACSVGRVLRVQSAIP